MASAAALFAVTAICLAPRIVLAQSAAAPVAANSPVPLAGEAVQANPAVASVAVSFSPEPGVAVSSVAALPVTAELPAVGPGPKLKSGRAWAVPGQPAVEPAPPTPAVLVAPALPAAPAPLTAQPVPLMLPGSVLLSAAPAPEPRPGRTPRLARAESADSTLEERLERLEKMVESLVARGYAPQYPYHLKPSPDTMAPMNRKEMAELDAKLKADLGRKHELNEREIEKIKERAKRESARAADLAKRAGGDAEKIAREQKHQIRPKFKVGSKTHLDYLRQQLEILDRQREELEHQIEELERNQEQLDQQENGEQDSNEQSDTSEPNPDSTPNTRP